MLSVILLWRKVIRETFERAPMISKRVMCLPNSKQQFAAVFKAHNTGNDSKNQAGSCAGGGLPKTTSLLEQTS